MNFYKRGSVSPGTAYSGKWLVETRHRGIWSVVLTRGGSKWTEDQMVEEIKSMAKEMPSYQDDFRLLILTPYERKIIYYVTHGRSDG